VSHPVNSYQPHVLEPRWQARWEAEQCFRARNPGAAGFDATRPKYYVLDMFPYPSGSGLHVGHAVGYIGTDIVARRKRMQGHNVLHPMGWDAFGLPAEQYAIQTGKHPRETTLANTATYRRQLKQIGLSYDWSREIDTSDERYYRWTQWVYKRLHERGLAYQAEVPVWWCEELKTVLANEEVINGRSERGNHPCVRRPLKQWMLKITAYAERLLADLDTLDWPESIKIQQREWIGRSAGAEVRFAIAVHAERSVVVFTTRPDTLWGATFLVLAPEHALVGAITTDACRSAVRAYQAAAASKSELDRSDASKQKSGVFTGAYALNPAFEPGDPRGRVPVWIADYVLASYGTGAIMSVPGHDFRDFEFALAKGLRVERVVDWSQSAQQPYSPRLIEDPAFFFRPQQSSWMCGADSAGNIHWCFTGDGTAVNSGPLDGLATPQAQQRAIELLEARGAGKARITYKLRDWLFSRQRYWGEPFPLLHLADGRTVTVPDDALPVRLPPMDDFKPSSDGSAPLARAQDWVATTFEGQPARRDTDTMPGWAGSCWYWLRFMDPSNDTAAWSREAEQYWGPVDLYVGGAAHAVMHLLYARFWHKVLYDVGLVHTSEPFQKLFNQGLITAFAYEDEAQRLLPSDEVAPQGAGFVHVPSGRPAKQIVTKMAKSLKNVVNPDEIIAEYGADTLRLYETFMGPLADSKPWNPRDIPGCRRFLDRLWRLAVDEDADAPVRAQFAAASPQPELAGRTLQLERELHRMLQRVDDSFGAFNLNTSVSACMSFLNEVQTEPAALRRDQLERLVLVLAPFAPHIAEELWSRLGHVELIAQAPWPRVEPRYLVDDELELPVQVNGKLRGKARVPREAAKDAIEAAARAAVAAHLDGQRIVKLVIVPLKLVNFVVQPA
jgi:leucyl-tRNA synthetase